MKFYVPFGIMLINGGLVGEYQCSTKIFHCLKHIMFPLKKLVFYHIMEWWNLSVLHLLW